VLLCCCVHRMVHFVSLQAELRVLAEKHKDLYARYKSLDESVETIEETVESVIDEKTSVLA
jgi:hypothetical protein